ncbi:MAG TPA: BTAD domain-containing putative transcriptional regulator [Gemmatimonadaceae bacterium]|nr:BTAD domain-containing putative transcriptional regulator [Gemmatimonadaceae bacterium]
MLRLRTFGGLSIERSAEEGGGSPTSTATAARRRLAFLAVLAASGPRGMPRDKLLALFWPESDSDKARHALDQTIYSLKRDLAAESLVLGREELSINPAAMTSDVEDFKAALARGDRAAAVELYMGPFLDGVFISGAAGFERWAEEERTRLTRDVEQALEALAAEAANRGDHAGAVQRWQRLATMEPRKTRVVLSLMSELAASGDRAAALKHAEIYHTLIRDDLDAEPNPAVAALAERLRREPAVVKSPRRTLDRVTATPAVEPPAARPEPVPPRRATVEWLRRRTTHAYRIAGIAVALVLLLTLSLAWVLSGKHRADSEKAWILPADVENRTQDSIFDGAVDAALSAGLQQSPHVSVFPRSRVQQTLTRMRRDSAGAGRLRLDETLAREVAQREGVHTVLATSIDRIDSSYMLNARLVEATTGVTIAAESRRANRRSEIIDAVDDLVRRLRRDIGESADAIAKHDLPLPQATTRSLEALRKYADGRTAWNAGQRNPARELYLEAVALDSDFALAHAALGGYYYWNNNRPKGDEHFDHALRLLDRLTDRERLQVRASAESWRGNREAAIELRKALLAIYPNDPAAWANIGYDYMRMHRPNEAIAAYRKQLARDSLDPTSYINLAVASTQLSRHDEAVRYYRRAFALQPSLLRLENLNHEYGEALLFAGKPDEARAVYDSMLTGDVDQRARGHRSLGLLAMIRGRYGEAIERFRDAVLLSQSPDHALTEARNRLFLASAQQEKGWRDSATAQIRTAHALFRRTYFEPMFLWFLGKALARDGQVALASEVLDTLRRRARADNPQDRANVLALGGEVALAQGRADSAAHLLQLAYATDTSSLVTESLATAIARTGSFAGAARLYESLLSKPAVWYGWEAEQYALAAPLAAGALYERANDLPHARAAYEQVLTRWAQGDTDLVTVRASRAGLARLRRSDNLTPNAR